MTTGGLFGINTKYKTNHTIKMTFLRLWHICFQIDSFVQYGTNLPCLAESAHGWVAHAHDNGEERVQILKLSTAEGINAQHTHVMCFSNIEYINFFSKFCSICICVLKNSLGGNLDELLE